MRIEICGFYGFGNAGDEAILQSIMDELGNEHEYIISTSLPYNRDSWQNYGNIIGRELRLHEDMRTDFDAYILGGGGLNWGYGWRQCLSVFSHNIPSMNFAVEYNKRYYYSEKLHGLYSEFLKNFDAITVRDTGSYNLLMEINSNMNLELAFDPAINLREEPFECPKNKIVVCPRYEDIVPNQPQLDWLMSELKTVSNDVLLVACGHTGLEGQDIDMQLCKYLHERLEGSEILNISAFEPRKLKYLISKSKALYSGGRYHSLVFAIAHDIPFKIAPTALAYAKIPFLLEMYQTFGKKGLIKLTNRNKELFQNLTRR